MAVRSNALRITALLVAGALVVLAGAQPASARSDTAGNASAPPGKLIKLDLPKVGPKGLHPVQTAAVKGAKAPRCKDLVGQVASQRAKLARSRPTASYLCDGALSDIAALSPAPMKSAGASPQAVWCATQPVDSQIVWSYRSRGEACNSRFAFTISFNTTTGIDEVAIMVYEHELTAATTSPIWFDELQLTFVGYTGELSNLEVDASTDCGNCRIESNAHAFGGFVPISLGQTLTGEFDYSFVPLPVGYVTGWTFSYEGQRPGAISIGPATEPAPDTLRCDDEVGVTSACVFANFTPELQVPIDVYGAAAINIGFANVYLPDGWGYLQPIARLADENVANDNRNWVCKDGTFVKYPAYVPDDSCDEFSFAASYMSARFLNVPGADCAEIMALYNASTGSYDLYQIRKPLTFAERCVRGHVRNADNGAVGLLLGRFTQDQRLLDGDYYYVYAV
jgi:hypothetical protein